VIFKYFNTCGISGDGQVLNYFGWVWFRVCLYLPVISHDAGDKSVGWRTWQLQHLRNEITILQLLLSIENVGSIPM